ncbi:MAG TPA: neutral zinc metallopeptidase [Candidatus Binatia bacterium]|nr:neutral zinc metallopeptidase [Candidatus Binatia bacterium]
MRWRRSSQIQVEDRRGQGGLGGGLGGIRVGGGGVGIPIPMGGGIGGIVLVIIIFVVIQLLSGSSLGGALGGLGGAPPAGDDQPLTSLAPDDPIQFVNAVTVDLQEFWTDRFAAAGKQYPETRTVVFEDQTSTGCGVASSATGPFYCPADQRVYLDLGFFEELNRRFGAPGDFAQAYVIAHEYGHHVQDALGIMAEMQRQQNSSNANDLSIRLELQADCLAGVWAHSVFTSPDQSDVESITDQDVQEAINAAQAVGDDRIQEQATGRIDRDSWTHGSAEQRARWFNAGFRQGSTDACNTFDAQSL